MPRATLAMLQMYPKEVLATYILRVCQFVPPDTDELDQIEREQRRERIYGDLDRAMIEIEQARESGDPGRIVMWERRHDEHLEQLERLRA